jgi:hypothetical protein
MPRLKVVNSRQPLYKMEAAKLVPKEAPVFDVDGIVYDRQLRLAASEFAIVGMSPGRSLVAAGITPSIVSRWLKDRLSNEALRQIFDDLLVLNYRFLGANAKFAYTIVYETTPIDTIDCSIFRVDREKVAILADAADRLISSMKDEGFILTETQVGNDITICIRDIGKAEAKKHEKAIDAVDFLAEHDEAMHDNA